MAIVWVCGGECRILGPGAGAVPDDRHYGPGSGTPSTSTTTVHTGTSSIRCNAAGATVSADRPFSATTRAFGCYVRFASLPSAAMAFVRFVNANGNMDIEVDNLGAITAKIGTGTRSASAGTVSTGTWYRIDALAESSTGTASLKFRVDGGTEQQATNAQVSVVMTSVQHGPRGAFTCDCFFDDILHGDATTDYPFGAHTVERMKPTRDSSHSFTAGDFAYNTAGGNVATSATDVWSFLDDDDLNDTSDLIRQAVIRSTGYVQIGFGTAPNSWAALAVMVVMSFHSSTTGANTFGVKMNDGGTLRDLLDESGDGLSDVSQTTAINVEKLVVTPPTGGTWTASTLGAILLRGGFSTDVIGIPYWDGAMLEVAYGPQPAGGSLIYSRRRMQTHLVR